MPRAVAKMHEAMRMEMSVFSTTERDRGQMRNMGMVPQIKSLVIAVACWTLAEENGMIKSGDAYQRRGK
jgi:hypothetical protein